jgi:polysaccharide biosynthesis protein PslG
VTTRKATFVLAVLAVLLVSAPAAAAVPKDFFGLVSEDVLSGSPAYRDATLAEQASAGVGLIRQTFHWKDIERSRGRYDWSAYDAYMAATASHGIRVLPILFDPPRFRAKHARHGTNPPRHYADLGRFGAAVAGRYGPGGSFWRANPSIPALPVTAYQVWNEPNLKVYWASGPSPSGYARLLRVTSAAIHRVDRHAEIVTAGLPDSRLSRPGNVYSYLRGLLRAGAARSFQALAVNPYARTSGQLVKKLRRFRSLLNHGHARHARIWVTEFGWSDRGPRSAFRVGVSGQARQIGGTIAKLVSLRRALRLRGLVYYDWRDGAPYPPLFRDFWGLHTGLLHRNGAPKPALAAFRAAVARAG